MVSGNIAELVRLTRQGDNEVSNQIRIWFNDRLDAVLKSDQPNYDLYVKGNETKFHFG